jgi:hypothetical protein
MYTGLVSFGSRVDLKGLRKYLLGVAAQAALLALVFFARAADPPAAMAAPRPGRLPSCLCGADFNQDGLPDRGVISSTAGSTFIRLSLSGRGQTLSLRVGRRILGALAFDVNRDGHPDIVALKSDLHLRVWLNDGHGQFAPRDGPNEAIYSGHRVSPRDPPPSSAFCCSSLHEDGGNLPCGGHSLIAAAPQASGKFSFAAEDAAFEDAFLAAVPPRGPPVFSSLTRL